MTKQNIKLTCMFIFGLPALPLACVMYLLDRYIVGYELPPEKRMMASKEHFIACMCALMVFCMVYGGIIWLVSKYTT